jgi:hypothetical protein
MVMSHLNWCCGSVIILIFPGSAPPAVWMVEREREKEIERERDREREKKRKSERERERRERERVRAWRGLPVTSPVRNGGSVTSG